MSAWDQLPGEPDAWFAKFDRFFRPLGPDRSLEQAYGDWISSKKRAKSTARDPKSRRQPSKSWYRAAQVYNWKARARAWDEGERLRLLEQEQAERAQMINRHVKLAQTLQALAGQALKRISDAGSKDITAAEARQYLKDGIALERMARGLPESVMELYSLSDEQLIQKYREILAAIAGVGEPGSGDEVEGDYDPDLDPGVE